MIEEAAIKSSDKIWTGRSHGDIIMDASIQEGERIPNDNTVCGFVDDKGKFLTREEAFKIAEECDQLVEYYKDKHYDLLQSYMLKK